MEVYVGDGRLEMEDWRGRAAYDVAKGSRAVVIFTDLPLDVRQLRPEMFTPPLLNQVVRGLLNAREDFFRILNVLKQTIVTLTDRKSAPLTFLMFFKRLYSSTAS